MQHNVGGICNSLSILSPCAAWLELTEPSLRFWRRSLVPLTSVPLCRHHCTPLEIPTFAHLNDIWLLLPTALQFPLPKKEIVIVFSSSAQSNWFFNSWSFNAMVCLIEALGGFQVCNAHIISYYLIEMPQNIHQICGMRGTPRMRVIFRGCWGSLGFQLGKRLLDQIRQVLFRLTCMARYPDSSSQSLNTFSHDLTLC